MRYTEYRIAGDGPLPEWVTDLLAHHLGAGSFESFSVDEGVLYAYVPAAHDDEARLATLLCEEWLAPFVLSYERSEVEERNWNEEWEQHYFRPLHLPSCGVTVRAPFHPPADRSAEVELIISPKMAFGTGNHSTTSLMLELIHASLTEGDTVIDMGCGSGILGIYALKSGAASCTSIDFDEWAVENTHENARLNGVTLSVRHGDASALEGVPPADLFVANITRNVILQDLPSYLAHTHSTGTLLLSGFYEEDVPLIASALAEHGAEVVEQRVRDRWAALCTRVQKRQ